MQPETSLSKNLILISAFVIMTPLALFVSAFSLLTLSQSETEKPQVLAAETQNGAHIFASLPKELPEVRSGVTSSDARAEIVRQYLEKYESPLEPHAEYIVHVADEYGLDFRLITAIAQQESNLCKRIPPDTYNCWGWGIHSRGTLGFQSYEEGILEVSKGLKENYLDKGYLTVEHIMTKYTPLSNGSWADGVSLFMSQMQ